MDEPSQIQVFDRALVRRHRQRAAAGFMAHKALFDEVAAQLIERLDDIKQPFRTVLDLGAHDGALARHLAERGIPFVVTTDLSEKMLQTANKAAVVCDEEFLPFSPNSFDLIVSNLSLHWVNDLPGALVQIRNALKPNGLFIASLIGGGSLYELRTCLMDAELKIAGGASPRLSPMIEMQTASALMQRAGFSLPVTDMENVTLTYPDLFALMRDLRSMGESNANEQRLRHSSRREVFDEAGQLYRDRFALDDGRLPASFEILFLHGCRKPG
jgi:SAM-dependent methyltransferase